MGKQVIAKDHLILSKAERRRLRKQEKKKCPICTSSPTEMANQMHDLVVIGAGPHALTLLLRLLEPEADFQSEGERHSKAEHFGRMRPLHLVRRHISKVLNNQTSPLNIGSIVVVDPHGKWMEGWKKNFETLEIPHLRSPTSAHSDPYDHRALELFAEMQGREDELIDLPYLLRGKPGSTEYRGPYQAPSTKLFHDYHDHLIKSYNLDELLYKGSVSSISPIKGSTEEGPSYELYLGDGSVLKSRRVVCALGPMFQTGEVFWETSLRRELGDNFPSDRLLHAQEIVPWISEKTWTTTTPMRLLVVGGGITSAQLALFASSSRASWCSSVTLVQRSAMLERQFDIESKWMGPGRGKFLDDFYKLNMTSRAYALKEARKGGSIPPEIAVQLRAGRNGLILREEANVSSVHWNKNHFVVKLDDGSPTQQFDLIWLATGGDNDIGLYPVLSRLNQAMPLHLVHGLPVLCQNLSWKGVKDDRNKEPKWIRELRGNLWVLGCLAGIQLGPDALNLIGARHGSVKVAKDILRSMATKRSFAAKGAVEDESDCDCGCC